MSYYVRQIFLIKGNDEALKRVQGVIGTFMERNPDDEVGIDFHKSQGNGYKDYYIVECIGRNTTFGNVHDALCNCGLSELHYIDYTDGDYQGSSDLGKFIMIYEENNFDIIAIADSQDKLIESLAEYFKENYEMSKIFAEAGEYEDIFEIRDAMNEVADCFSYYRYLECGQYGVSHETDVNFFP